MPAKTFTDNGNILAVKAVALSGESFNKILKIFEETKIFTTRRGVGCTGKQTTVPFLPVISDPNSFAVTIRAEKKEMENLKIHNDFGHYVNFLLTGGAAYRKEGLNSSSYVDEKDGILIYYYGSADEVRKHDKKIDCRIEAKSVSKETPYAEVLQPNALKM